MKPQLIVFGEDWGAHPSSTQHLMCTLQADVDVIWINSIGLRRPKLHWRDVNRIVQKVSARFIGKTKSKTENPLAAFPVISPLVIPLAQHSWLRRLNRWLLSRQLRQVVAPNRSTIVWTSLPSAIDYVDCFPNAEWVYYCGDDFGALAGVDHALVVAKEAALVNHVQRIWVASEKLAQRFAGKAVELVEHGVDIGLFQRQQPRPSDLPQGVILGFYGAIADWLDQQLLADVARLMPQYQLVFIGPVLTDVSSLQRFANVHFLGERPHHALPAYVQHWTASILPFKDNEQIRACNPLKLREYLAVGTPVLSTDFPAMQPYAPFLTKISTSHDIVAALQNIARQAETDVQKQARQNAVADESWSAKAQPIRNFIFNPRIAN